MATLPTVSIIICLFICCCNISSLILYLMVILPQAWGYWMFGDSWRAFRLVMSFESLYYPKSAFSGASSLGIMEDSLLLLPKITSFHKFFTWVYFLFICRLFIVGEEYEDWLFTAELYALWFLCFLCVCVCGG